MFRSTAIESCSSQPATCMHLLYLLCLVQIAILHLMSILTCFGTGVESPLAATCWVLTYSHEMHQLLGFVNSDLVSGVYKEESYILPVPQWRFDDARIHDLCIPMACHLMSLLLPIRTLSVQKTDHTHLDLAPLWNSCTNSYSCLADQGVAFDCGTNVIVCDRSELIQNCRGSDQLCLNSQLISRYMTL